MCSGKDCPFKEACYRFTAEKNQIKQSFFVEPPIKNGDCEMYTSNRQYSILEQLKEITNDSKTTNNQ